MRSAFTLSFGIWAGIILGPTFAGLASTASNDLFPSDDRFTR
jgi:hypothetical protein